MINNAFLKIPNDLRFGVGAAETLPDLVKKHGAGKVLLISDYVLEGIGIAPQIKHWLQKGGSEVEIFLDVEPEPSIENVDPCLSIARTYTPDVIVGLGGGSVLDIAKTVAMLAKNPGNIEEYLGTNIVKQRGIPTVLVPTTSGTGAEITPNALFYIPNLKAKKAIVSEHIIPDAVVIDPKLTQSVPPRLTAATGLDALCHAIESYTGLNATPLTEPFSKEAIRQIGKFLRTAVFHGENIEARTGMALGSLYAAIAIANAGTNAVHALAYPLQGINRIQHGVANSLLLPYVMSFNMIGDVDKFSEIAELLGVPISQLSKRAAAETAVAFCKELSEDIGIPQHMREVGVKEDQIEELVEGALNVQRLLDNNPRPIAKSDIENIYRKAL